MAREQHAHDDQLLDDLFSTMVLLGRTIEKQHTCAHDAPLAVPRMLALRMIADSGACRAGDIAHLLSIKAPATSALLDGLERDGLVVREHSQTDRRVVKVRLTEAGRTALDHAEDMRRDIMRERLSVLSEDDIRTLIRIQQQLIDAVASDAE